MVSYNYDAWGNVVNKFFFKYGVANAKTNYSITLGTTVYTAQDIDNLNNYYYRGYYYDKETGFYYLTTRYYDPKTGRFISSEEVLLRMLGSDIDLNEKNNITLSNIANDKYNKFENKNAVMQTKLPSFYKGIPVLGFENDFLNSFSFGFIFINTSMRVDENIMSHEWGHSMQFFILGMGDYLNMIFLPSCICNLINRNNSIPYYQLPWEVTADMFGGVNRNGTNINHQLAGIAYFAMAEILSNAIVKPALLPVYLTAASIVDLIVPGLGTLLFTGIYAT